jgi:hypothetical protein
MNVTIFSDTSDSLRSVAKGVGIDNSRPGMITGRQLTAGRVIARLSLEALAEQSGVSAATIRRAEAAEGTPTTRGDNLARLVRALEKAGVVFLAAGDVRNGGEGVRLRRSSDLTFGREKKFQRAIADKNTPPVPGGLVTRLRP